MYNRYIGNTGRRYRVPDASDRRDDHEETRGRADGHGASVRRETAPELKAPAKPRERFSPVVPALPFGLDAGDIMLLALLFFLYTESGDEDFLIILAVVCMSIITERRQAE